ncbi:MAG: YkgJ family cysteine cluster protein [Desulfosalsimonadaceae bacterium]
MESRESDQHVIDRLKNCYPFRRHLTATGEEFAGGIRDPVSPSVAAPVDEKEPVFLSIEEAITALRIDFGQYAPQTPLFMDLCPLVLGPNVRIVNDSRANGLWIATPGRGHVNRMRRISPRDLGHLLVDTLSKSAPPATLMAEICRRTFLVHAMPSGNGSGEKPGVWVHMDMDGFECRQCGRCCRELDYRHEILPSDYDRWMAMGRDDIVERVAAVIHGGRIVACSVWVEPGTRRFSEVCPWLAPADPKKKSGRWRCRIHDCKPDICKQYPGTRKHARMTGCIGFDHR